jgi:trehalose 6-phosphate phosphatase
MKKLNDQVIARIAAEPSLFLFLDYDGTLTPIASGPSKAKLSGSVRQLLRELKAAKGVRVAIVSGRSLANLKQYVRIPGLIYAGNHGFEIQGHGISYVHPAALALEHSFRKMTQQLKKALGLFHGILIEHKTFSISIHYRNVRSYDRIQTAKKILLGKLKSLRHTPVVLADGKKVWEIRPTAEWHKGETVTWLLRRVGHSEKKDYFPVYAGDDVTDEDAFRAIRKKGVGIKVTCGKNGRSQARYYVRSTAEAVRFLRKIISLRKAKGLLNVQR